jgi:hypothetical protein
MASVFKRFEQQLVNVRYGAHNGLNSDIGQCPLSADFVAKVDCDGSGRYAFG